MGLSHKLCVCSNFQQLKVLQSSLPALAQSEAQACKTLIEAFNIWFAVNYASPSGTFEDSHLVSLPRLLCLLTAVGSSTSPLSTC